MNQVWPWLILIALLLLTWANRRRLHRRRSRVQITTRRCAVYEFPWLYGPQPAYTGSTVNPTARFRRHARNAQLNPQHWWHEADHSQPVRIVWFPDERSAQLNECNRINSPDPLVRPVYNVRRRGGYGVDGVAVGADNGLPVLDGQVYGHRVRPATGGAVRRAVSRVVRR